MTRAAIATVLLALAPVLSPSGAMAQTDDLGGASSPADTTGSTGRAVRTGLLAGGVAFATGFVAGVALFDAGGQDTSGPAVGVAMGSILGSVALPLGVHAGNGRRGNGWLVMGSSLMTGAAGLALAATANSTALLPVTAAAQLLACLAVERATMPEPDPVVARRSPPRLGIAPTVIDGRAGVVVAGGFRF